MDGFFDDRNIIVLCMYTQLFQNYMGVPLFGSGGLPDVPEIYMYIFLYNLFILVYILVLDNTLEISGFPNRSMCRLLSFGLIDLHMINHNSKNLNHIIFWQLDIYDIKKFE